MKRKYLGLSENEFYARRYGTLEERFWRNVQVTEKCWNWTASCGSGGYGQITYKGKHLQAHRVSFEWKKGKIPESFQLDHLCRNRKCVNPDHLEPVTSRENTLRGCSVSATVIREKRCPKGHTEFYQLKSGVRACLICRRSRTNKWAAQNRGHVNQKRREREQRAKAENR